MDTINRLLNKQEPKRRRKGHAADGSEALDDEDAGPRAPAAFVHYIQTVEGSRLAVPDEWLEAPVGEIFNHSVRPPKPRVPFTGRLIEEIS